MVQGSYPRYVDEEKQRLLKEDEENQLVEVTEILRSKDDEPDEPQPEPPRRCRWARWKERCRKNREMRKKRPVWRRILRVFFTVGLFWFLWASFSPFFMGIFGGCRRHWHHGGPVPVVKVGETPFEKPKMHYEFESDITSFFVRQETDHKVPTRSNVFGSVKFIPTDDEKTYVDFHVKVSDEKLWDDLRFEPKKDGIVFSADAFSIVEQFINVTAVISLPEKNVKKLFVSTRELDISFDEAVKSDFDVVRLSSVAGNIHVHGTQSAKCTKLQSVSGDLKGSFDLVRGLAAKTISGNINLDVTPVESDGKKAFLGTQSVSGETKIHVIHPLNSRDLKSWHKSTSGDISVRYPEEWQGKMKLSTTSGDFHLKGKHLDVKKKSKGFVGKAWKAIKGDGKSRAKLSTISGDVYVSVGDE